MSINPIYFKHQQTAVCAHHALNMLLQRSLYTYDNLRDMAREMRMKQYYANTNMDYIEYFSIQVIQKALDEFSLKLRNMETPLMYQYKTNPLIARAYMCNLREHWFVLRKFGSQWFELDSKYLRPFLLPDFYLPELINQLSAKGYKIYVVEGNLPSCYADNKISLSPVVPPSRNEQKKRKMVQMPSNSVGRRLGQIMETSDTQEDYGLAIAIANSVESKKREREENEQLKKAIAMSLEYRTLSKPAAEPVETPILSPPTPPDSPMPRSEQKWRSGKQFTTIF
uniref:ubiquitinyl hydrolase 1 n=1 Tax=Caenorhabditis japonica TaxID=281687 RepID=A0A8R1DIU6_CAEJA